MDESKRYLWHFLHFISFFITNFIGGCQHNTIGLLGGYKGHPSSQFWEIMHIIKIMFKIIFPDSGLIIYYFDHFLM